MREDQSVTGRVRKFHLLDAIRGIAALLVVQRHAGYLFGSPEGWWGTFLAVDLFFVLSGFVVAYSYEDKLLNGEPWLRFMKIRLIRLYPLYLLGLAFGILQTLGNLAQKPGGMPPIWIITCSIASGFLMLPSWGMPPLISTRWSLTYELVANSFYAAIAKHLTAVRLLMLLAAGGVCLLTAVFMRASIDGGWDFEDTPLALGRVTFSFFAGVLLYRIHVGKVTQRLCLSYAALSVVLSILAALNLSRDQAVQVILIVCVFPLLTLLAAKVDVRGRAEQICGFLGVTSYAVYLMHQPTAALYRAVLHRILHREPPVPFGWLYLIGLLAGCWLLDHFYDNPVRRTLRRRVIGR